MNLNPEMTALKKEKEKLKWSELPEGFQKLLTRSYEEYKEIRYDPCLHPLARKIPTWKDWLNKHDIQLDQPE
ncbi:hypothetical protein PZB74_19335 [Porifericola rhodea]|uniref:hypothetical protein n=1 Tax=Porifericola rhodea TaxID=930972 RepID=UPI0026660A0A|nr:hypothetical protein [Porifericola rhodea]WKN31107.1 hypothetical protein PZB74_19335 [Porifericola rhodea]